jgi:hypothetical protein
MHKIYFLKEGIFSDSSRTKDRYTQQDLQEIARSYNPEVFEAPIVIGHTEDLSKMFMNDKAPSFGWVKKVGVDKDGLYALADLAPELEDVISRDVPPYKYVSAALYENDNVHNPTPGKRYLRHIAFLGAQPPAIKGLEKMVKLYRDSGSIANTKMEFMLKQYEETVEVQMPDPQTASTEEITQFLQENTADFLIYILTDGEYGYPGTISRFEPEPSLENNFLYDAQRKAFSGVFYDDESGEVDGFKFEIKSSGNGEWTSSYQVVNQEEDDDMVAMEEELLPSAEESAQSIESSSMPMEASDEASMEVGVLPEAPTFSRQLEELRNEVRRLNAELSEIKANEFRAYADSLSPALHGTGITTNEVVALLYQLDGANTVRAYSDAVAVKPLDFFKSLMNGLQQKLSKAPMVSYGEMMTDGDDEDEELVADGDEYMTAYGTAPDAEQLKLHKKVLAYCAKAGLDPKNSKQYTMALKKVVN